MRKIMNRRIFTSKTLCQTKVKNHDLPPVGFSLFTITGKFGYNATQPVTSNSHTNVQHSWTLSHVLVSPRPGQCLSITKEWIFLPYYKRFYHKQIVRAIKALMILPRLWTIQSHSQNTRFSLFESSHNFLNEKPNSFSNSCVSKTNYFSFYK